MDNLFVLVVWWPEFFRAGGVVMVLLLVCSVLTLAVCLERSLALRRGAVLPERLLRLIEAVTGPGDADHLAKEAANLRPSPLGSVVEAALANLHGARDKAEDAVAMAGRGAASSLERGIGLIEIAAATAPLLGLLGTVVGMVEVFGTISVEGFGEAQVFSAGIKKALYTTVAGLTIGIPSLALFIHFSRCVERRAIEMEKAVAQLLDRLYPKEQATGAGSRLQPRIPVEDAALPRAGEGG